jgi:hypothetical protein
MVEDQQKPLARGPVSKADPGKNSASSLVWIVLWAP